MAQPNDPLLGEEFENEATGEYPVIEEGYYVGAMGRSYKSETPKQNYKMKVFEVLVIKKSKDAGDPIHILTSSQNEGGRMKLALRKNKNGELITESVLFQINFMDIREDQTQKAKAFLTHQRQSFARRFEALNEDTGIIDWGKIQKSVGQIVSFNLIKNKSYINLDFETFVTHAGAMADKNSITEIYQTLDSLAAPTGGSPLPDEPPF